MTDLLPCPRCAAPSPVLAERLDCEPCALRLPRRVVEQTRALDEVLAAVDARPVLPASVGVELRRVIQNGRRALLPQPRSVTPPRAIARVVRPAPVPSTPPPAPKPLVPDWLRHLGPAVSEHLLWVLGAFLVVAGAAWFTSTAWTTMSGAARLLVLEGGLGLLGALFLGVGRLARSARERLDDAPSLARLERAVAHLAALLAPLGAVVAGRALSTQPLLGTLALAVAAASTHFAWRGVARVESGHLGWARLSVAALCALAASGGFAPGVALAAAGVCAALLARVLTAEGPAFALRRWPARAGATRASIPVLGQLAAASLAVAAHVGVLTASWAPVGLLVSAWGLALALLGPTWRPAAARRTTGRPTAEVVAAAFAVAGLPPCFGAPTALLGAALSGAVTFAVVGRRRDSLAFFAPALPLSLMAYVLLPAPIRTAAAAARDAFAAGLGYTSEPLPLAWYGLTCAPYLVGCAWLAGRLAPRHARLTLRWTLLVAIGLAASSLTGPDLRAPAVVLLVDGVLLVALGLWRERPLLWRVGPALAIAGGVCAALHFEWGMAGGLLAAHAAALAAFAPAAVAPARRDVWRWAATPALLIALPFAAPTAWAWTQLAPLDVAPFAALAALCVSPIWPLGRATAPPLAVLFAARAAWPFLPDASWAFALTAGLGLLVGWTSRHTSAAGRSVPGLLLVVAAAGALSIDTTWSDAPQHIVGFALSAALAAVAARREAQPVYGALSLLALGATLATTGTALGLTLVEALPLAAGLVGSLAWLSPNTLPGAGFAALPGLAALSLALPLMLEFGPLAAFFGAAALGTLGAGRVYPRVATLGPFVLLGGVAVALDLEPALAALLLTAGAWLVRGFAPVDRGPLALGWALALGAWALSMPGAPALQAATLLSLAGLAWTLARGAWLAGALAVAAAAAALLVPIAHASLGVSVFWQPAMWCALALGLVLGGRATRLRPVARPLALLFGFAAGSTLALHAVWIQLGHPSPHPDAALGGSALFLAAVYVLTRGRPHAALPRLLAALPLIHAAPAAQWILGSDGPPDVEIALLAVLAIRFAPRAAVALAVMAFAATRLELGSITTPLTISLLAVAPLARRDERFPLVELVAGGALLAGYAWLVHLVPRSGTSPLEILTPMALIAVVVAGATHLLARRADAVIATLLGIAFIELLANLGLRAGVAAAPAVLACALAALGLAAAVAWRRARRLPAWIDVSVLAALLVHALLGARTEALDLLAGRHLLVWAAFGLLGAALDGGPLRRRLRGHALGLATLAVVGTLGAHRLNAEAALVAAVVFGLSARRTGRPALVWGALALFELAVVRLWLDLGVVDPAFYGVPLGAALLVGAALQRAELGPRRAEALQLLGLALAWLSLGVELLQRAAPSHAAALMVAGLATVGVGWWRRRGDLMVGGALVVVVDTLLFLARRGFARDFTAAGLLLLAGVAVLGAAALHARRRETSGTESG